MYASDDRSYIYLSFVTHLCIVHQVCSQHCLNHAHASATLPQQVDAVVQTLFDRLPQQLLIEVWHRASLALLMIPKVNQEALQSSVERLAVGVADEPSGSAT
jgi:hypothetical protein